MSESALRPRRPRILAPSPVVPFPIVAGLIVAGLVVAGLLAGPASAAQVQALYEAEVPVSSKSPEDRDRALGDALRQVMVKITGSRRPETSSAVAAALASPGRFLQQFAYRTRAEPTVAGAPPTETLWLHASFDPGVVDAVVRDAGLAVWGSVRPDLLVWMAVEREGARELVGAVDSSGLGATLVGVGIQRGVPVILPLLDLEDRAGISAGDVWAGFEERIRAASRRYPSDTVLVGRVYKIIPTLWEASWTLLVPDGAEEWTSQGGVLELAVEDGIQQAADRMATRFASLAAPAEDSAVDILVRDVRTVPDYARVLRYFAGLDAVRRVDVTGLEGDHLRLRVQSQSGRAALGQTIALGRTLAPDEAGAGGTEMRLRLLP